MGLVREHTHVLAMTRMPEVPVLMMMTPWVLLKTSKKSAAMKCLITNKEYNLVDLDRLEGRAEGKFKQRNDAK